MSTNYFRPTKGYPSRRLGRHGVEVRLGVASFFHIEAVVSGFPPTSIIITAPHLPCPAILPGGT